MLPVEMTVNGERRRAVIDARLTLADFLREQCALTGTHLGCEHGVCGACTVLLDGEAVRACLLFAVQVEGADVTTIEGLHGADGALHPVQEAFRECHALQCGIPIRPLRKSARRSPPTSACAPATQHPPRRPQRRAAAG